MIEVRINNITLGAELNETDIGPGFLLSQRNRNNRSTADPSGIEVRELLKLRSQDDQTAAQQLALGLSKNSRKDLKAIKNRSKLDSALGALRDIPGLWAALNGGLKRTSLEGSDDVSFSAAASSDYAQ